MLRFVVPFRSVSISRTYLSYHLRYSKHTYTTMTVQSLAEWQSDTTGSFRYFTKPIQKSPQDDREYRLIRLENGLEAMLVHDAKADKAAASLDVAVGHLYDPVRSITSCFFSYCLLTQIVSS